MRTPNVTYRVQTPGLAQAVSACTPAERHEALLRTVRAFPGWEQVKLAAERSEGWTLVKRKVLSADGALVAEDHEDWLKQQVAAAGGAEAARKKLLGQGYLLTETKLHSVFLVVDRGGARADDFVQMEVRVENEFIDRALFSDYGWGAPRDVEDLLHELGAPLDQPRRYRAATYTAGEAIDIARFVDELNAMERAVRTAQAKRLVTLTDTSTGESQVKTFGELHPRFTQFASNARRLFDDWAYSSAGRSGARFCAHWVLVRTNDDTNHNGVRHMGLTPGWAFRGKLAEVKHKRGGLSDYELAGKLQALDQRVKVPFGWYFFMLHGNRVKDWAGRQMLAAAEAGQIVLPEHDYRILKNWDTAPYGF